MARGLLPALVGLAGSGCLTLAPMQPASTVAPGVLRLGGQAAGAPWCSLSGDLAGRCAELPQGTPLPELRAAARLGLDADSDLGASLGGGLALPPASGFGAWGGRAALQGDYKRVLWRGGPWLLSLGGGLGAALVTTVPRGALATDLELQVPLRAGYQAAGHEWVGALSVAERLKVRPAEVDPAQRVQPVTELGLTLGMYPLGPGHFSLEVGYVAPVDRPGDGRFLLALGLWWDLALASVRQPEGQEPAAQGLPGR